MVHRSNTGEGTSSSGASPAAAEGDYLAAEQPEPDSQRQQKTPAGESGEDLLARVPADMPGTRDPSAKTWDP